jgi:hypothetical protein
MYLAYLDKAGKRSYELRQSYFDSDHHSFQSRLVFALGSDPSHYICQLADDICYFHDQVVARVEAFTDEEPTTLLENLLWAFLPLEERRRLEVFRHRRPITLRPLTDDERQAINRDIPIFDRRRLYYLRYGAVDQSKIARVNAKLYRPLLYKSRDEREYYIRDLERALHATELRTYVFAIFDLQRHFHQSYSATMPEALNQVDIADHFVDDLCRLNRDPEFWRDEATVDSLRYHLIRYLIMFFDHGYGRRSLFDDFLREFMGRHRTFRWPERKPPMSTGAVEKIFAMDWRQLRALNRKQLARLYRQRAKKLHPDSGGDHEQFIALNAAYASLLVGKREDRD